MLSELELIRYFLFWQQSTRIVETGIEITNFLLRIIILSLYIKNHVNTVGVKTEFDEIWYNVE